MWTYNGEFCRDAMAIKNFADLDKKLGSSSPIASATTQEKACKDKAISIKWITISD